jgi:hypothetical protein
MAVRSSRSNLGPDRPATLARDAAPAARLENAPASRPYGALASRGSDELVGGEPRVQDRARRAPTVCLSTAEAEVLRRRFERRQTAQSERPRHSQTQLAPLLLPPGPGARSPLAVCRPRCRARIPGRRPSYLGRSSRVGPAVRWLAPTPGRAAAGGPGRSKPPGRVH